MDESNLTRRTLLAAAVAIPLASIAAASEDIQSAHPKDINMTSRTFTKTPAPDWLLAFWREIDDKTWGKGFDCFKEGAIANLGVSDWHGREAIRENLRAFVDTGFTAHPGKKATCGAVGYVAGFSFRRRNQATVRPRTADGGARARLKRHLLLLQSSAATELATNERLRCSDGEESFPTIEASYRGGSFPTCRDRCPLRNEPRFQAIERQLKFPS